MGIKSNETFSGINYKFFKNRKLKVKEEIIDDTVYRYQRFNNDGTIDRDRKCIKFTQDYTIQTKNDTIYLGDSIMIEFVIDKKYVSQLSRLSLYVEETESYNDPDDIENSISLTDENTGIIFYPKNSGIQKVKGILRLNNVDQYFEVEYVVLQN